MFNQVQEPGLVVFSVSRNVYLEVSLEMSPAQRVTVIFYGINFRQMLSSVQSFLPRCHWCSAWRADSALSNSGSEPLVCNSQFVLNLVYFHVTHD